MIAGKLETDLDIRGASLRSDGLGLRPSCVRKSLSSLADTHTAEM